MLQKIAELLNIVKKGNRPPWYKFYGNVAPKLDYPDLTMYELIEKTAKKYPNNIALEYYKIIETYSTFMAKINRVAKSLKTIGVKENDVVTICMPNTPAAVEMFYAVNKVGAIANMIHPLSSENEIKLYLTLSKSKYVLSIDASYEKIKNIVQQTDVENIILSFPNDNMNIVMSGLYWLKIGRKSKVIPDVNTMTWHQFLEKGKNYKGETKVSRNTKDKALILYSGGTTGDPKGIVLSNLNFNALAMQAHLMCDPSKAGDSILSIMPIFHGFGLGVCIHTPLYIGMKCILIPTFSAKNFASLIKQNKPNFLVGVPTLFEALLKSKKIKKKDLSCVTCIVSGGDSLSPELKKKVDAFLKEHGSKYQIREGYGLTECSGASCLTPSNFYKENSIGIPFPDTTYKIVKIGTFDEADPNEDGEIVINGPSVMIGYLEDQEETNNVLKIHDDGKIWLHTGDIGCIDKNSFVYFKQRLKRIIVSSGYNLYPKYIENVIESHPDVLTSSVVGIPHPYKMQVAKAYIVLKDGVKATYEVKKSIKDHCTKNLAKYSLPYEYEFRDAIPKTKIGKVDYRKLEKGD